MPKSRTDSRRSRSRSWPCPESACCRPALRSIPLTSVPPRPDPEVLPSRESEPTVAARVRALARRATKRRHEPGAGSWRIHFRRGVRGSGGCRNAAWEGIEPKEITFRHVRPPQVPCCADKEKRRGTHVPRRRIMSPQVPLGRHPEPGFREVTFRPHQARPTDGACTTAASMVRNRRQLALVQGIYGLDKHRREQLVEA